MRRLMALIASVALVAFVTGVAIAQEGGANADQGASGEGGASIGGSLSAGADGSGAEGEAEAEAQAQGETEAAADSSGEAGGDADAEAEAEASAAAATEGEGTRASAERDEGIDAGTYAVRLRDLEQRINELKEQIFRSKARLSLLAETVLQGVVAGSQTVIVHENKMSASYRLVKAVYALDGAPIFNKADESGELGEREEFQVYNGSIVPGQHTLTVNLEYRGHGYGIFSYLKGYRFKVRSSYSFTAPEGKAVRLRVVGYEKGGPTAPLEERPAIKYIERVKARSRAAQSEGGGDE